MAKQIIEAPRQSLFLLDPEDVVLIGRDTDDGPSHPRYDVRVHNQFDEDIVLGMMKFGPKKPISVVKNGDALEVVDGRQRVINCREANRRLKEMGAPLLRIKVLPPERGDDAKMAALIVLLNEHAIADSAFGKGQKAQKLLDMGHTLEEVASLFKVSPVSITNYTSLLNLIPEIQQLVIKGEIPATKGYALAQKDTKFQKAFLDRRQNGSRSGQHVTKAPAKKTLQKIVASNTSKVSKDFIMGVRFALGLVKAQDVKGLEDLLNPSKEETTEEPETQIVPSTDTPEVQVKMANVNGKMVPVRVLPPAPPPEDEPIAVKNYGTLNALND